MSVLRAQCAARLLPTMIPIRGRLPPIYARHSSDTADRSVQPAPKSDPSEAPAAKPGDSAMIRQQGASAAMVDHSPNFRAPVDHGTS